MKQAITLFLIIASLQAWAQIDTVASRSCDLFWQIPEDSAKILMLETVKLSGNPYEFNTKSDVIFGRRTYLFTQGEEKLIFVFAVNQGGDYSLYSLTGAPAVLKPFWIKYIVQPSGDLVPALSKLYLKSSKTNYEPQATFGSDSYGTKILVR